MENEEKEFSGKRKKPKRKPKKKIPSKLRTEIILITVIALSIISIISLFFDCSGIVCMVIKNVLKGILGIGGFMLPIITLTFCLYLLVSEEKIINVPKTAAGAFLIFIIMVFLHISTKRNITFSEINEYFSHMYMTGSIYNGGLAGGITGDLLIKLIGKAGAFLVLAAAFICDIMVLTGIPVFDKVKLFLQHTFSGAFEDIKLDYALAEPKKQNDKTPETESLIEKAEAEENKINPENKPKIREKLSQIKIKFISLKEKFTAKQKYSDNVPEKPAPKNEEAISKEDNENAEEANSIREENKEDSGAEEKIEPEEKQTEKENKKNLKSLLGFINRKADKNSSENSEIESNTAGFFPDPKYNEQYQLKREQRKAGIMENMKKKSNEKLFIDLKEEDNKKEEDIQPISLLTDEIDMEKVKNTQKMLRKSRIEEKDPLEAENSIDRLKKEKENLESFNVDISKRADKKPKKPKEPLFIDVSQEEHKPEKLDIISVDNLGLYRDDQNYEYDSRPLFSVDNKNSYAEPEMDFMFEDKGRSEKQKAYSAKKDSNESLDFMFQDEQKASPKKKLKRELASFGLKSGKKEASNPPEKDNGESLDFMFQDEQKAPPKKKSKKGASKNKRYPPENEADKPLDFMFGEESGEIFEEAAEEESEAPEQKNYNILYDEYKDKKRNGIGINPLAKYYNPDNARLSVEYFNLLGNNGAKSADLPEHEKDSKPLYQEEYEENKKAAEEDYAEDFVIPIIDNDIFENNSSDEAQEPEKAEIIIISSQEPENQKSEDDKPENSKEAERAQDDIDDIKEKSDRILSSYIDLEARESENAAVPFPEENEEAAEKSPKNDEYVFPKAELLEKNPDIEQGSDELQLMQNSQKLVNTLKIFKVDSEVTEISRGPSVTRYELKIQEGIKISKIHELADNLAYSLAAPGAVRIEAPIPGKTAVGIEIPNKESKSVYLSEVICSEQFRNFSSKLAFGMGKDITGEIVIKDIAQMPHLLIAGTTGSGKSVCINTLITSILYKSSPEDVRMILIDPKVVELSIYNGIPHLLVPVVTNAEKALGALNWAVCEMDRRFKLLESAGAKNLDSYNEAAEASELKKLPKIIIIIDEFADLMMTASKDIEKLVCRIAQKARAAGIHLVVATQRPSVDVITGVIKANIASRIAFKTSNGIDSKTILGCVGAEKLIGNGDMLVKTDKMSEPARVQCAFISDKNTEAVINFIKENNKPDYSSDVINSMNGISKKPNK